MKKKSAKKQHVVNSRGSKLKIWSAFIVLFVCGMMTSINDNPQMACASTTTKSIVEPREMTACEIIENELLDRVIQDVDKYIIYNPNHNIEIYTQLTQDGCPENIEKYTSLLEREKTVVAALTSQQKMQNNASNTTCTKIEQSLLSRLPDGFAHTNSEDRIERAKIYANLSERGCPENQQKYYDLAKQELEIARAIEDDEFDQHDTIEVVETYKRLNMQAAAQEIFDTAKKLTNPTIDFILEVEKIINEQ